VEDFVLLKGICHLGGEGDEVVLESPEFLCYADGIDRLVHFDELFLDAGFDGRMRESRQSFPVTLDTREDIILGLDEHRDGLGPACGDVGHGMRAKGITVSRAPVMGDEVGFYETGYHIAPIREGTYRNLALEKASRLGHRTAARQESLSFGGEESVDRGSADDGEFNPDRIVAAEGS